MGVSTKIVCDQCDYDLTYGTLRSEYHLVLGNGAPYWPHRDSQGAASTDMIRHHPVDQTYTFCGIGCLAAWLAKAHPKALDAYDRMMIGRERRAAEKRERDEQMKRG